MIKKKKEILMSVSFVLLIIFLFISGINNPKPQEQLSPPGTLEQMLDSFTNKISSWSSFFIIQFMATALIVVALYFRNIVEKNH